jgi:CheY-like chemotaxis protein
MRAASRSVMSLVVADDDQDDQMLIREVMESYSVPPKVTVLTDGAKLMEYLYSSKKPDLILLDLNMPYKTGLECLIEIRADDQLKDLPVVVFSTSKGTHDIDSCFLNGAQLFFTKPCTFDGLRSILHSLLMINWDLFPRSLSRDEFYRIARENSIAV